MKKIFISMLILAFSTFIYAKEFNKPSFSCSKVQEGTIEYKICANEDLSKLDVKLSKVYTDVRKTLPDVLQKTYKTGQRSWIKERNACGNEECLKNEYQDRISYLTKLLPKNKAFSPYLVFELINLFECDDISCSEPVQKEIYEALMSKKGIKILDPIAWGNSLEDDVFKKYLGGMNEHQKNKISYVGLKQDERYRSIDTFNYSSDSIKESMKKGDALKAMCNFKLYGINYTYYNDMQSYVIEEGKAFLMFADANMNQENILKKEKAEPWGSLISIVNPKTFEQVNVHQFRRKATTNCYEATKTVAGIFLYGGIYYHFESWYSPNKNKYYDIVVTFIQKDTRKFDDVMNLRLKRK